MKAELKLDKKASNRGLLFYKLSIDGKPTYAGLCVSIGTEDVTLDWTANIIDKYHKFLTIKGEELQAKTPGFLTRGK